MLDWFSGKVLFVQLYVPASMKGVITQPHYFLNKGKHFPGYTPQVGEAFDGKPHHVHHMHVNKDFF